MKLAIISHTPHYKRGSDILGWGPTVREVNHLTEVFGKIYHVAPLHLESAPSSSMLYESEQIVFVPLKPYGGSNIRNKVSIFTTAFHNLNVIRKVLKNVDWVQFRSPTAMGVYVLPYLSMRSYPRRWVKYAGNWKMKSAPFSYRFQKWWLENNFLNCKVTINGDAEDERKNILNFRNPCLDNEELQDAIKIADNKEFDGNLTLCFSGSLTANKGVGLILESLKKIKNKNGIEKIIFAGDGPERGYYERLASKSDIKAIFKGFISRDELKEVYANSHIILLPSQSEGFPKVIAEAAAYGCVPIVSDVSAIKIYFNDTNGFLLKTISSNEIAEKIDEALSCRYKLKEKSGLCMGTAKLFTYDDYIRNLREKILLSD